jgi:glycosyltransferase involved in cell wall biosynthesis
VILLLTVHYESFRRTESPLGAAGEDGLRSPLLKGASISGLRQLEALAAAPFVDRLILHAPTGLRSLAAAALATPPWKGRVEALDEQEIRTALSHRDPVIVLTLGPDLLRPQLVRWICGNHPWPVCGYTYAISPTHVFRYLVLAALSGLQPYDAFFCCSRSVRESLGRLLQGLSDRIARATAPRLPLVPLGIPAAEFRPRPRGEARRTLSLPDDAVVFLYLGRIDPRYKANLQPLLTAFSRLKLKKEALLVVAGAEPADKGHEILDRLRFRSIELEVGERVRWLPSVSAEARRDLLSAADVFVSPADNLQESFGIALVEAMCCGLPVIASDWDGYRDIVVHEETGLLVRTRQAEDLSSFSGQVFLFGDPDFHWALAEATVVDVPALERAMARLAADSGLRRRMGRAGQERANALYDWGTVLRQSREEWETQLALAREAPGPPPVPLVFDHAHVFATHPADRLRGDVVLRRTSDALHPSIVVELPPPFLSRERLQEILQAAADPTALARLPGDPPTTALHAAYLLKHGFLEIVG